MHIWRRGHVATVCPMGSYLSGQRRKTTSDAQQYRAVLVLLIEFEIETKVSKACLRFGRNLCGTCELRLRILRRFHV